MDIKRVTDADVTTESDGMRIIKHDVLEMPIIFFFDELEKYSDQRVKWHWHPEMEFMVAMDNPIEIYINDTRILLRKDEGIWINANKIHMIKRLDDILVASTFTIVMMPEFIAHKNSYIYSKFVEPWINDAELSYILFLDSIEWHQEIVGILKDIFRFLKKQEFGYELSIHNSISKVWLLMLEHQKEVPRQMISRAALYSQTRLKTMVAYVKQNYALHITLMEIADSAHVSKSECIRCFKRHLGVTPIQYLTEYRLTIAAQLLTASCELVSAVAERCGFDDFSYFSRLFKKRYGLTPLKYRKQHEIK